MKISRDEVTLRKALWGLEVPVDPGEHTVTASAPGRRAWSTRVALREGQRHEVIVPLLVAEGSATLPAPKPEPEPGDRIDEEPSSGFATQRGLAIAAWGIGVAMVLHPAFAAVAAGAPRAFSGGRIAMTPKRAI